MTAPVPHLCAYTHVRTCAPVPISPRCCALPPGPPNTHARPRASPRALPRPDDRQCARAALALVRAVSLVCVLTRFMRAYCAPPTATCAAAALLLVLRCYAVGGLAVGATAVYGWLMFNLEPDHCALPFPPMRALKQHSPTVMPPGLSCVMLRACAFSPTACQ